MHYSIIKKSQLEGALRMDAEYYQPEYLHALGKVRNFSDEAVQITELLSRPVVTGTTPKKRDCVGDGTDIKFVKTDVLREGMILFDQAECLPQKESRRNSEPKTGDVLITIIGATHDIVGRVARVYDDDPRMNINQNIVLLRPKDKAVSSYLSLFLQGRYGRDQLWQQSRQTEQVNLNCREVENIIVPLLDASSLELVDKMVLSAHALLGESTNIYSQAEAVLLKELGLEDFKAEDELYSVVKLSEVKEVGRMDAEYFEPRYKDMEKRLEKYGAKILSEIIEEVPARFNASTKANDTFQYVELANINASVGIIDGSSEVLGKEAPSRAKRILEKDDVIVSSIEGSLEKVALVDKTQDGHLASTGFFQLRSNDILPETLLILAKSIVFNWQLQQRTAGTILTAVPHESLKTVLVPILPKSTQQKIAELVRASHAARKKAKRLLEEAKRKVEEMIESKSA